MGDVAAQLLDPSPVALARAHVLRLVAADPLTALDGEQPRDGDEPERHGQDRVLARPPWLGERRQGPTGRAHPRASAASASSRDLASSQRISKRTGTVRPAWAEVSARTTVHPVSLPARVEATGWPSTT